MGTEHIEGFKDRIEICPLDNSRLGYRSLYDGYENNHGYQCRCGFLYELRSNSGITSQAQFYIDELISNYHNSKNDPVSIGTTLYKNRLSFLRTKGLKSVRRSLDTLLDSKNLLTDFV